jgi:Ser/Thr protein kinase RdoA (MazF antagonist)
MIWPDDHPVLTDPALKPWADGLDEILPRAVAGPVLRYLPGRRATTAVWSGQTAHEPGGIRLVVKVFASPRARGSQRRLAALAAAGPAGIAPQALGADASGHVLAIGWVPGRELDGLTGSALVAGLASAGARLRALHQSPAVLDREWTWVEEAMMLRRKVAAAVSATGIAEPEVVAALLHVRDQVLARTSYLVGVPLVPVHRDCHPKQAVVDDAGRASWIDLDDASMGPALLDLGNLLAHLDRDRLVGRRSANDTQVTRDAFLAGYLTAGPADLDDRDLAAWELLSLTRLVAIALERHRDVVQAGLLLTELERRLSLAGVAA